jgi:hypothetical protein
VSGTPKQFVLHIRSAIHACKQMGLDAKFAETEQAVIHSELEAELAKVGGDLRYLDTCFIGTKLFWAKNHF